MSAATRFESKQAIQIEVLITQLGLNPFSAETLLYSLRDGRKTAQLASVQHKPCMRPMLGSA